ncbi:alkaline-phosphatase-like protein, partial [Sporodiniella umbellata]
MVIDALRFDFAIKHHDDQGHHYLNKLPILQHLLESHPQSSLLYQFRADPPTTTTQRIKGLMTGSLPTFIDAGSNFASSAVQEDHLLHHIQSRYKSIYLMGDDTWTHLYPDAFKSQNTFASDSFKMLDLDSVDNDILKHLWPLLENKNHEWNLTIAHFLGVDHCGHTHGPSHPNMARKLTEMNGVIERLLAQIDNDTLLVVMGDHGMSPEGDHGGESLEELMSTLFIHSKRTLIHHQKYYQEISARIHDARSKRLGYNFQSITDRLNYDALQYPVVAQIHLVPTLAYLLQVPIPFGNLGALLPDILVPEEIADNQIRGLLYMIGQFRINALQVHSYLIHYSKTTHQLDFSSELLRPIFKHIYAADDLLFELASDLSFIKATNDLSDIPRAEIKDFQIKLEHILLEYDTFLTSSLHYCESIWARFDTGSMAVGIFLLGFGLCISVWFMSSTYRHRLSFLFALVPLFGFLIIHVIYSLHFEKMNTLDWIGSFVLTSAGLILWNAHGKIVFSLETYAVLFVVLLQSATLGSNSFVVWEDHITRYVLSILVFVWLIQQGVRVNTVRQLVKSIKSPLLVLVIVRVTSTMGQCREEQFPYCQHNPDVLSFDDQASIINFLSIISLNFVLAATVYR